MGYKITSFVSVSSTDEHEYFLYYLPAYGMASLWLNQWVNSNFDRLATLLGPKAVLITAPEGGEEKFLRSAAEVQWLLHDSLKPLEGADFVLYEGGPLLLVSRQPLPAESPKDDVIACAAINLAAYDPKNLAKLFDHVITAIRKGEDPVESIPIADAAGPTDPADALELKPNIFGIGINGNAVIKMLRNWRERRRSQPRKLG